MGETSHKIKLRKLLGGWSESYEPGQGSGVGYPDLQFLVGVKLLPVEIKRGSISNGKLYPEVIRPSQIVWHDGFLKAGGLSLIFVAFEQHEGLCCWATPLPYREVTSRWRLGYVINHCHPVVHAGKLVTDLAPLMERAEAQRRKISV